MEFTIQSEYGNVVLRLTDQQYSLLDHRLRRSFMKMCSMDSLLAKIDLAGTTKELEAIAEKYYICDVSDFSKITVNGVKKTLKILVKMLYQFPKLRSRFCYVGTHSTYAADIQSLINGDTEIMKDFGLHYICDSKIARDLGGLIYAMARDTLNNPESYVATVAISAPPHIFSRS